MKPVPPGFDHHCRDRAHECGHQQERKPGWHHEDQRCDAREQQQSECVQREDDSGAERGARLGRFPDFFARLYFREHELGANNLTNVRKCILE